jgi:hypothetical protein
VLPCGSAVSSCVTCGKMLKLSEKPFWRCCPRHGLFGSNGNLLVQEHPPRIADIPAYLPLGPAVWPPERGLRPISLGPVRILERLGASLQVCQLDFLPPTCCCGARVRQHSTYLRISFFVPVELRRTPAVSVLWISASRRTLPRYRTVFATDARPLVIRACTCGLHERTSECTGMQTRARIHAYGSEDGIVIV